DIPSTSGNGNPGGNTPSTSGNDNPGGSTPPDSGNGNPGGSTPPDSGNGNPGGSMPPDSGNGNPGGSTPPDSGNGNPGGSTPPDSGNGSQSGGSGNPDEDKYEPANTPWTPEPKTGDGISTRLYATTAMIFGFTYLILLFSEKHGMTEEIKNELLSRLIRWAKYGGKLRRLLALAGIFLLLAYYHSIGKQVTAEEETGLTA
ncbi:MAG: hypothetical protein K2O34_14645, partial [Acetatifactor sp.]|nr:hypothetical protein [Acetatifactor sp.]